MRSGMDGLGRFLERDGPRLMRTAGRRLHLLPPERSKTALPIAIGVLGAVAAAVYLTMGGAAGPGKI